MCVELFLACLNVAVTDHVAASINNYLLLISLAFLVFGFAAINKYGVLA
jgi:hypothetical protein